MSDLSAARAEINRRFLTVDMTIKRGHQHVWNMTRDLALRVLDEHLGYAPHAPDGAVAIARDARAAVLRDFATWAGRLPDDAEGAFQHNSLREACLAMADFYDQGRLDDRIVAFLGNRP